MDKNKINNKKARTFFKVLLNVNAIVFIIIASIWCAKSFIEGIGLFSISMIIYAYIWLMILEGDE